MSTLNKISKHHLRSLPNLPQIAVENFNRYDDEMEAINSRRS